MSILKKFVQRLVEASEASPPLPWEIIEFLVRMYADEGSPPLAHTVKSLSQIMPTQRHAMTGGYHIEWKKLAAFYDQVNHALVLNQDASGTREKKVTDVLHEIEHYNQHIRWDSDDLSYRDSYVKGKKLPPAIAPDTDDGDPAGLYEISWRDLTKFWVRRYGYLKSPHEVDARKFAAANIDEALDFIVEHFGDE